MARHGAFKILLGALILFSLAPVAYGDLYWESLQETKGVSGQADSQMVVKNYLGENSSRSDMGEQTIIMDFGNKVMYELNRQANTYTVQSFTELGKVPGLDPEKTKGFEEMVKRLVDSFKVVPSGEEEEIAGYKCKRYDVTFMMAQGVYWLSSDVVGYDELKKMGEKMAAVFEENPLLKQLNLIGMISELHGFPVKSEMKMMGGTVTNTLHKVEKKKLSRDLFKVPKGYTKK